VHNVLLAVLAVLAVHHRQYLSNYFGNGIFVCHLDSMVNYYCLCLFPFFALATIVQHRLLCLSENNYATVNLRCLCRHMPRLFSMDQTMWLDESLTSLDKQSKIFIGHHWGSSQADIRGQAQLASNGGHQNSTGG